MNLFQRLQIRYPIIQAPMAGVTTPEFVAASARAGLLGSIGAGYMTAKETNEAILAVRDLTDRPFAVNLFVPDNPVFNQEEIRSAYMALQPIGEKLGLPFWKTSLSESEFDQQLEVILNARPAVCSFTFGLPERNVIHEMQQEGIIVIGTATTVEEAVAVQDSGMDMVVLQGEEAGGHRGSFYPNERLVTLDLLLKEAVKTLKIPVIAAGGISTGSRMDELLKRGATAVQIGTALLASEESGASTVYKQAIKEAVRDETVITSAFSGRPARGIRNRFIEQMKGAPIAPYPYQNDLTKRLRKEAAAQGMAEYISLWAGTEVAQASDGTIEEIIMRFFNE